MKNKKLKSFLLGIKDSIPVISTFKENVESKHLPEEGVYSETGKGKIDWVRLATAIGAVALIVAFLMGKITIEDLKSILGLI